MVCTIKYHDSIEYRDTFSRYVSWHKISGIAQHYVAVDELQNVVCRARFDKMPYNIDNIVNICNCLWGHAAGDAGEVGDRRCRLGPTVVTRPLLTG